MCYILDHYKGINSYEIPLANLVLDENKHERHDAQPNFKLKAIAVSAQSAFETKYDYRIRYLRILK